MPIRTEKHITRAPEDRLATLKLMVGRKLADIAARKAAGEVFKPPRRRYDPSPTRQTNGERR